MTTKMHEFIHNDEKIIKVGEPIFFENKTEEADKENSMIFDVKPIQPIRPLFGKDKQDFELWKAITTAINLCGIYGEEVTMKGIETLKQLGRYDLLPPCECEIESEET